MMKPSIYFETGLKKNYKNEVKVVSLLIYERERLNIGEVEFINKCKK